MSAHFGSTKLVNLSDLEDMIDRLVTVRPQYMNFQAADADFNDASRLSWPELQQPDRARKSD